MEQQKATQSVRVGEQKTSNGKKVLTEKVSTNNIDE